MIMPGQRGSPIRMFISWLRHIIRTTASRPYSNIPSVLLRLIRRFWQVVVSYNERPPQERGSLVLGSQLIEQDKLTTPVTLAVPLLHAPSHEEGCQPGTNIQIRTLELDEGSHAAAFTNQSHQNSCSPLIPSSGSEPSIYITPPQSPVPGHSLGITLTPITPSQIRRNDRNAKIRDEYVIFEVEKGPLDCSEELVPVAGWEPLTHPSGALFFYHPYKRVFTDADVRDPETAAKMGKAAEKAYEKACDAGIALHPSVELALELTLGDGRAIGYYFVDHDRRVIFWFEAHKCIHLMLGVRGVERKSHVRYALESEYWGHINLFPNKRRLPEDVVVRLKELLIHAQAEYIDLGTSLSPFASEQVESLLGLIDPLMSSLNMENEHSVRIVARCMERFCIVNFLNFCGQPSARRNTNKSLYEDSDKSSNTILSRVMNIIMFGSPDAHRKVLHWILVDKKIIQLGRYRNFTDRLNSEWNGYAIFSTVLLAVDISFLAVPFVQTQTSAILISYLSTLCAMGSFVVTLVFARQLNDGRRYPAERVASFMFGMKSSIERLALMLSLPFAFLIWGVILFAASLSVVIFRTSDVVTVSIAYPIWAAIVILATWPALAGHISTLKYGMMRRIVCLKWYSRPALSGATTNSSRV